MPRTAGVPIISSVGFFGDEANPSTNLGQFVFSQLGQGYRYTLAGAADLVNGNIVQAKATDTQFNELAVTATAAATNVLTLTNGTTVIAAGDLVGGNATVSVTPGIGQSFTIIAHDTAANGASFTITTLEPVQVALTTSSKVTLRPNANFKVVQAAGPVTAAVVGAVVHAIPASKYGWTQTKGIGAALSDATVTAAATMGLSPSAGTAGAVTKHVNQDQYLGRSLAPVMVSAKVYPVVWQLD